MARVVLPYVHVIWQGVSGVTKVAQMLYCDMYTCKFSSDVTVADLGWNGTTVNTTE